MKVAIFVPCHIYYDGQINLLESCIKSLLEQTMLPDAIYISVSFDATYKGGIGDIMRKYGTSKEPKVIFKPSNKQLYQMEHLYRLHTTVMVSNPNEYDMVMFCDDDDTYNSSRVETFVYAFECGIKNVNNGFGGVREYPQKNDVLWSNHPEYWAYGVSPFVMEDFFKHVIDNGTWDLLLHKFGDMYFRLYLIYTKKHRDWAGVTDCCLYNYNTENPNSICAKRSDNPMAWDNIIGNVMYCMSREGLDNIIRVTKLNKNQKRECERIYELVASFHSGV